MIRPSKLKINEHGLKSRQNHYSDLSFIADKLSPRLNALRQHAQNNFALGWLKVTGYTECLFFL